MIFMLSPWLAHKFALWKSFQRKCKFSLQLTSNRSFKGKNLKKNPQTLLHFLWNLIPPRIVVLKHTSTVHKEPSTTYISTLWHTNLMLNLESRQICYFYWKFASIAILCSFLLQISLHILTHLLLTGEEGKL